MEEKHYIVLLLRIIRIFAYLTLQYRKTSERRHLFRMLF